MFCVRKNACQPEKQSLLQKGIPQKNTSIFAKSSPYQKNRKIAHWVLEVVLSFLWLTPKRFSEHSFGFRNFFIVLVQKKSRLITKSPTCR